ncbi:MAG TPA: GNAT family N-acetyltransferase, partial [Mycobacteriales bacterium]|nr:GNAT family N-acetyltransferase [Mycobacteriales bacterium]
MTLAHGLPRHPVEIPAGALWVRSAARTDAAEMFAAVVESGAELSTTMPWWREDLTETGLEQWLGYCESAWNDGAHFEFSVGDPGSRYLGSVGIGPINWQARSANLSYWVRTSRTNQGIGSTASRAVARWACQRLGLQR